MIHFEWSGISLQRGFMKQFNFYVSRQAVCKQHTVYRKNSYFPALMWMQLHCYFSFHRGDYATLPVTVLAAPVLSSALGILVDNFQLSRCQRFRASDLICVGHYASAHPNPPMLCLVANSYSANNHARTAPPRQTIRSTKRRRTPYFQLRTLDGRSARSCAITRCICASLSSVAVPGPNATSPSTRVVIAFCSNPCVSCFFFASSLCAR